MLNKIIKNYPNFERKILEFQKIAGAEDMFISDADFERQRVLANQFVLTADANGLSMFENLYGIIPQSTDSLELRRERILIRIQLQPPYTVKFLKLQLDKIIGKGQYELNIDYDKFEISIGSVAKNQTYAQEISIIMGKILPCNMRYITTSLVLAKMLLGETDFLINIIQNYRLGTTWNLGQKPFASRGDEEVIKMAGVSSFNQKILNETAQFLNTKIAKVLVNGTQEITTFDLQKLDENVITVEYSITEDMNIPFVRNIKLLQADGSVITNSDVYVPVIGDVVIKHKITVAEGE
nr:MAG TPA: tail protein [Caudoviricetes sp.]